MMFTAITREVSPGINDCELSFHVRQRIDVGKAVAQHGAYQICLTELGARLVSLPAEAHLPDAVFVEDPAIVLDEVAVIMNMGVASRRLEAVNLAKVLEDYRTLKFLVEPATMDGGDVVQIGRRLFVGLSKRTNREGIRQLGKLLQPFGYSVQAVEMRDCLHLKSACSYLGGETLLVNKSCINTQPLHGFELLEVAKEEPAAANVLLLNGVVVMPDSFPRTRAALEARNFPVWMIDVSELQKAEAGVTCCSLILRN